MGRPERTISRSSASLRAEPFWLYAEALIRHDMHQQPPVPPVAPNTAATAAQDVESTGRTRISIGAA